MRLRKTKKAAAVREPEYHERLEEHLSQHGGKVFLVDSNKNRVLNALQTLFSKTSTASFLCVVQDPQTAWEYQSILGKGREVTLITSKDELLSLLVSLGVTESSLSDVTLTEVARRFVSQYPYLIVCFENTNGSVLHATVCETTGKNGQYGEFDTAPYCVSDFLAACYYSFAVVDGVYEMISFEAESPDHKNADKTPDRYEQMFYGGTRYYTETKTSYRRLSRLVDSADSCVLLSDLAADGEAISLYAALHLINDSFSYKEASALARAHEYNYLMECENFFSTAMGCCGNDTILSLCLQYLGENQQWYPKYLRLLGSHIKENLDYLSQDETYLRFSYAIAKRQFNLKYQSNNDLLMTLGNPETIAYAYCDAFFNDELKGEFESKVNKNHICRMGNEEIELLMTLFSEFGGYVEESAVSYQGSTVRIYHDESAFEELIRSQDDGFDKEDDTFSVSHLGDDGIYKCAVVKQMIDDGTWETPVLVVSADPGDVVAQRFNEKLDVPGCASDLTDHGNPFAEDTRIYAVDYTRLRNTAMRLPIKTVAFFDVLPDANLRELLLRKAALLTDGTLQTKFVVSYTDLNGHMAEAWSSEIKEPAKTFLPVRRSALFTRSQQVEQFSDLMGEVDQLYRDLKNLVEGHTTTQVDMLCDRYAEIIAKHTTLTRISEDQIKEDFRYFAAISAMYRTIFENTATVGSKGRDIYLKNLRETPKKKQKIVRKRGKTVYPDIYEIKSEPSTIMFNVCAQQLHCTCDVTVSDCGSCLKYRALMTNVFSEFAMQTAKFFEKTVEVFEKAEKNEKKNIGGRIIAGEGNRMTMNSSHRLAEVLEHREGAMTDLQTLMQYVPVILEAEGESRNFFCTPYETVKSVREHVSAVYIEMFKKYYAQFFSVFDELNGQMKNALGIAVPNDADASSANTK